MAALSFDFSGAKEPALALRLANLLTQDIERLEKHVFGTTTNWQRLDKPFKAHYAVKLVNEIMTDAQRDLMLAALPSYEKNAQSYKRDSKRRGRPLTEYSHKAGSVSDMSIQVNQTKPVDPTKIDVQDSDTQLDQDIMELLSQPAVQHVERMQNRAQGKQPQPQPQPQPQNLPKPESDTESPVNQAMKALAEAVKQAAQPQAGPLDEDRVREIAREEDAGVLDVVKKAIAAVGKPTLVTVERKEKDTITITTVELGLQHTQFATLLKLCGVRNVDGYQYPVWLPGPAGSGKTTAARNVAKALGIPFQFTGAVDNPYQLLGFRDAGGHYHRTSFREAFEHGGVFLWDEVDASNPNALTVFNAALENGVCAFPDGVVTRHVDCIIIAAANTYGHGATHEYVGRNKMDAATVDRFIMLDWTYDEILERNLSSNKEWCTWVQKARKACAAAGVKHVISPRASIRGSELLADGFDRAFVERSLVRKGLPDDSWMTITNRMK